ncbi:MAG: YdeI/OmpD-associated family protein [Deltaproteobacteria bacterium]|nr:YdeI/OmpD-associated family protein [Deltaproteobacteria bacterium]
MKNPPKSLTLAAPGNGGRQEAVIAFADAASFARWIAVHHVSCDGVWLRIAKKASGVASITYAEALDEALSWGWIDGIRKAFDETTFVQRFTPRRAKSIWSQINREKVAALIEAGRMREPGLREVERAKADGRWEAAYAPLRNLEAPDDLRAALAKNHKAARFFDTLNAVNRYAVIRRVLMAKKMETRERKIREFVAMMARGEKIYP